jgi:hypothetical protein
MIHTQLTSQFTSKSSVLVNLPHFCGSSEQTHPKLHSGPVRLQEELAPHLFHLQNILIIFGMAGCVIRFANKQPSSVRVRPKSVGSGRTGSGLAAWLVQGPLHARLKCILCSGKVPRLPLIVTKRWHLIQIYNEVFPTIQCTVQQPG